MPVDNLHHLTPVGLCSTQVRLRVSPGFQAAVPQQPTRQAAKLPFSVYEWPRSEDGKEVSPFDLLKKAAQVEPVGGEVELARNVLVSVPGHVDLDGIQTGGPVTGQHLCPVLWNDAEVVQRSAEYDVRFAVQRKLVDIVCLQTGFDATASVELVQSWISSGENDITEKRSNQHQENCTNCQFHGLSFCKSYYYLILKYRFYALMFLPIIKANTKCYLKAAKKDCTAKLYMFYTNYAFVSVFAATAAVAADSAYQKYADY